MDLSDLTLPLTKLAEVVAAGIGETTRPSLTYKDKRFQISPADSTQPGTMDTPAESSLERAMARLAFQEQKRQGNIESIVNRAAEALSDDEEVSSAPLDGDWIARFFRIVEDISTKQMQALWGCILAGEIGKPGSFSLRTLEVLRNISRSDAEIFSRVAELRITTDQQSSFLIHQVEYLAESFGISASDILLLRELDLVVASDLLMMRFITNPQSPTLFRFGQRALMIESSQQAKLPDLNIIGLTSTGHQLAQLVQPKPSDGYIRKVASLLKHDKVAFKAGILEDRASGDVQITDVQPLTDLK